jgi:hypothetical protein
VLFLESNLNISKYLTKSTERSVRDYFQSTFPRSVHRDELAELFAVRDAIAHNHVWRGTIDPIAMRWVTIDLLEGYGDKAFRKAVDMARRVTNKLGLNVVPSRLCYADVRVVLQTTAAILVELRDWHLAQPDPYRIGVLGFGNVVYRRGVTNFLDAASLLVPYSSLP